MKRRKPLIRHPRRRSAKSLKAAIASRPPWVGRSLFDHFALGKSNGRNGGTLFLTDRDRFPMADALTTDLGKARIWNERTGPWKMMRRNPAIAAELKPIAVSKPVK